MVLPRLYWCIGIVVSFPNQHLSPIDWHSLPPLACDDPILPPPPLTSLHCSLPSDPLPGNSEGMNISVVNFPAGVFHIPALLCETVKISRICFTNFFGQPDISETMETLDASPQGCLQAGSVLTESRPKISDPPCLWLQTTTKETIIHHFLPLSLLTDPHTGLIVDKRLEGTCSMTDRYCKSTSSKFLLIPQPADNCVTETMEIHGRASSHGSGTSFRSSRGILLLKNARWCCEQICNKTYQVFDTGLTVDHECDLNETAGASDCALPGSYKTLAMISQVSSTINDILHDQGESNCARDFNRFLEEKSLVRTPEKVLLPGKPLFLLDNAGTDIAIWHTGYNYHAARCERLSLDSRTETQAVYRGIRNVRYFTECEGLLSRPSHCNKSLRLLPDGWMVEGGRLRLVHFSRQMSYERYMNRFLANLTGLLELTPQGKPVSHYPSSVLHASQSLPGLRETLTSVGSFLGVSFHYLFWAGIGILSVLTLFLVCRFCRLPKKYRPQEFEMAAVQK